MKKAKIYTLADPDTLEIRYIGFTGQSLKVRLNRHITESNKPGKLTHKQAWLKGLSNPPIMEVLDEVDYTLRNEEEIYWIEQFKIWGFNLVNLTTGGDGGDTYSKQSPERQKEISNKLSKKAKGRSRTPEQIDKWRNSIKERGHWLTREKHPMLGKTHDKESLEKMKGIRGEHKNPRVSKYPSVNMLTLEGNLIATYKDAATAAKIALNNSRATGNILKCCKYEGKSAYGFKWEFNQGVLRP